MEEQEKRNNEMILIKSYINNVNKKKDSGRYGEDIKISTVQTIFFIWNQLQYTLYVSAEIDT